jgi:UDP-N-acetylmuramoylalanine--D-glutamate ligase
MTDTLTGKKVVVLGLARQGMALARWLAGVGAQVTVSDLRDAEALSEELAELDELPVDYALGGHPDSLLDGVDLLAPSAGVPIDAPIVVEARRRGISLTNDAQLFLERCPAPVIGITGSAGKTTTTALVGAMCGAEANGATWVGGNIGNPLIADLPSIQPGDRVVIELSSFQLEVMTVGTPVAAVLNVTPNHLDRHKTMMAYAGAKSNLLRFQPEGGVAVLGADDSGAAALADLARGQVWWFSGQRKVKVGAWLDGDQLCLRAEDGSKQAVCRLGDIRLRGYHNVLNALAACAIAGAAGMPVEAMREGITSFTGVVHRLEVIGERGGVTYVNDSIATAPERVLAALKSYDQDEPLLLLLGGRDKDLPWRELMDEAARRCKAIIAFGEAGEMIVYQAHQARRALHELGWGSLERVPDLESAVRLAAELASPGDVVLLSPGCTSFDAYHDFAERGEHFRALVSELG